MDDFMKFMFKLDVGDLLYLDFLDYKIYCSIDTMFETIDMEDEDSDDPEEYYACAILILKIDSKTGKFPDRKVGELMEVSRFNEPLRVFTNDNELVWEKGMTEHNGNG
ncbi:MAG: hypothetical protein ACOX8U_06945 [Bradymonadia bacterium]